MSWELKILEPDKVKLYRNRFGELVLEYEGERFEDVIPLKAFPLSAPENYIALIDSEDNEIGIIEDLNSLPEESRRVLREELEERYMVPKILKVLEVEEVFGMPVWRVVTDKGERTIELMSRSDAKLLPSGKVIIRDIDGNRYEIPNYWDLDPRSRSLLDTEL
ncbi:DUF1854 domain-containing protein [Candidatus Poribacteria bacterium]|nr:MAG: DUF1854 domain-containing protein [Candidatus Poribacteria bacterium]